jgi:type IV secretory pathway VirB10-like protein
MPDIDKEILSPTASPMGLGKHSGVKRVNNMPLYLIGAVIAALFLLVMSVEIDRAQKPQETAQAVQEKHGDSLQLAKSIAGNEISGMIPAAGSNPQPSLSVPIAIQDDLKNPPLPNRLKENAKPDAEADHIKQEKMQRFENAITGKTTVPFLETKAHADTGDKDRREQALQKISDAKQKIAAMQQNDANTTFKAKLTQLQNGDGGYGTIQEAPNGERNDLKQFDAKDKSDRWQLDSQIDAPKTPYILRAGFIIPASLISGINSDLPGQIIGQVSQNVYDTATGKYLLLPQGSRLVGSYTSDVAYGQSRVMVAWQRIIFPDGKTLDIGAMPGSNEAGYAGFNDEVNNHYLRLFGSAILMSGITAGVAISQDNNSNSNIYAQPTASSALSEALGQQLGNVTAQMISKNLNISPTLEIRPGFRFNVMCIKDLVLTKPYSSFDYGGEPS